MAAHDLGFFVGDACYFSGFRADIFVAGAVETISADFFLAIVFKRKCVQECLGRHGLVERSIEHTDMLHIGQQFLHRVNAGKTGGIVQRRQSAELCDFFALLVADDHAFFEELPTMSHTVTHCSDFVQ